MWSTLVIIFRYKYGRKIYSVSKLEELLHVLLPTIIRTIKGFTKHPVQVKAKLPTRHIDNLIRKDDWPINIWWEKKKKKPPRQGAVNWLKFFKESQEKGKYLGRKKDPTEH